LVYTPLRKGLPLKKKKKKKKVVWILELKAIAKMFEGGMRSKDGLCNNHQCPFLRNILRQRGFCTYRFIFNMQLIVFFFFFRKLLSALSSHFRDFQPFLF
jgi:hypothetical protein